MLLPFPAKGEQKELDTTNKITNASKQNALQYILQYYSTSPWVSWCFVKLQLVPEPTPLILPYSTPLDKQTRLRGVMVWYSVVSGI